MQGSDGKDYTQCLLRLDEIKDGAIIRHQQVSWIPVEYAIVGEVLRLRCPDGMWINGWEIAEVYQSMAKTELKDVEHAQRRFHKLVG